MRLNDTTQKGESHVAELLRIAGDESRLKILCVIFEGGNVCVSDIAKRLSMSVAIVSHHLKVMARAGLLESVREGKMICYVLPKKPFVVDLKKFICKYK